MKKIKDELIFKLILAVFIGLIIGFVVNKEIITVVMVIKDILGQVIFFTIPLIIIGFIAPTIASLKTNATKLLGIALSIAYLSTLGGAIFSMISGYILVPLFDITPVTEKLNDLPELVFQLNIPPIMSTMSALAFALLLGVAVSNTNSKSTYKLLQEFQNIVLDIVTRIIIPILPFFIGGTFSVLAYEGAITKQLPVFLVVILIVIIGHFIWLSVLYSIAGMYTKTNPKEVFKHYIPAYFTAVGTMSSAATLPVALSCARKSSVLNKDNINFSIPLFTNIHLCGSVITEVFFVMVVSQILYNQLPSMFSMLIFVVLLGLFGIGAPGVPGGTVMASLGLITGVLGFDTEGIALMMTIFALQDSFGTACNVTGDGALTLIMNKKYEELNNLKVIT